MGLLGPVIGRLFDRSARCRLTVTGSVLLVRVPVAVRHARRRHAVWVLIALHVVLIVGAGAAVHPGLHHRLNPLPPHLYSHGSAILSTLQQVAGAAGTALLVAIMSGRGRRR